jgi:hypothetical protein
MDIAIILTRKFPGALWSLANNDYADLAWESKSDAPTEEELQVLWPTVQYEIAYEQTQQARAQAYRETADPLFFQYQRGEITEQEWLDAVQEIKNAHPYPEQA